MWRFSVSLLVIQLNIDVNMSKRQIYSDEAIENILQLIEDEDDEDGDDDLYELYADDNDIDLQIESDNSGKLFDITSAKALCNPL